ncbi:MAG: undecaprenyl-phosphate galactose phosphotransferase [uncultured bacterium]|nr:MAG: undecaprenyl-phosphate galactose phosphotransferase [uncultured bacterium]
MQLGTTSKPQIKRVSLNTISMGSPIYIAVKRIADIIFSLAILSLTAPIMLILVGLIKLESRGPALYLQERVGQFGKVFKVFKLRTMYIDKPDIGGGVRTTDNDPRVTRVGKIIRGCSLDEFPQFINILKGEMSYIGPRPISLDEHNFVMQYLEKENKPIPQGLIHKVKPGITGWALLHGREKISYEDRFKFNAEYENNISLLFDFKIFFLTFKKYFFTNIFVLILFLAITGLVVVKL